MTRFAEPLSLLKRTFGFLKMDDRRPIIDESEASRSLSLYNSENDTTYAELMNGSVPCPSCNGRGNIPREMETQLVALIPVSDSRLKPRRTCLWVSLGMGGVITIASLAIFFLLPREVSINSDRLGFIGDINMVKFDISKRIMEIEFPFQIELRNDNYFWVHMNSFNATFYRADGGWDPHAKSIGEASNMTQLSIPPRSSSYPLSIQATIKTNDYGLMLFCNSSIDIHHIMKFIIDTQSQVAVSYFWANEIETLRVTKSLCCMPSGNCTDTPQA